MTERSEVTLDISTRVEHAYNMVDDLATLYSPDDPTLIRSVRHYANLYARFALARAQQNLWREGSFSAARAVEAQAAVLEALEKGV